MPRANKIVKSTIPPTKTVEQGIALLTRQLQRLEEVSKLNYDSPEAAAWENTTINLLNDIFGKPNGDPHENTWEFEHANGGPAFVDMDEYALQDYFLKKQSKRKALLGAYIEQLNDQVSTPRVDVGTPTPRTLKKPKELRTAFSIYQVEDVLGEGGAGLVYSAKDQDGNAVAIKVLNPAKASTEKLKRFKNEFRFCAQYKPPNIISVSDNGLTPEGSPFFVMPRYQCSLRKLIGTLDPQNAFALFKKILDGVDAAHRQGITHRDLKPENILVTLAENALVVSDFGVADFEEDELYSTVETKIGAHVGNYQYAAPEQRARGKQVDKRADIYSLGLILNELFTSELALGVNYKTISTVSTDFSYLDSVVSKMLEQSPSARYSSIDELKSDINLHGDEFLSRQKISQLNGQVIPVGVIDDVIASDPIRIVGVDWENGQLTIELNHSPNEKWIWALHNMGGHSAVYGKGPELFRFSGNKAKIQADENEAQRIIDYFKQWLPIVASVYQAKLETELKVQERNERAEILLRKSQEEKRLKIKSGLKF